MNKILDEVKKDMKKARVIGAISFLLLFIIFLTLIIPLYLYFEEKISLLLFLFIFVTCSIVAVAEVFYSYSLRDKICKLALRKILNYQIDNETSKENFARLQKKLKAKRDTELSINVWLEGEIEEKHKTVEQEIINRKI